MTKQRTVMIDPHKMTYSARHRKYVKIAAPVETGINLDKLKAKKTDISDVCPYGKLKISSELPLAFVN